MDTSSQPADRIRAIAANIGRAIQGKDDKIELLVLALIAGGHVLIEDIPGVGKTTLARALAKTVDGKFSRIQFTPDLLPSDVTGINVFEQSLGTFTFKEGPVFANILLADEINRASARTQSALLEAMSEDHVTIDGQAYPLPRPFIVLATQNPIEYHGTYPLPEAQLDRFMLQIDLGYPPEIVERSLIMNRTSVDPVETLKTQTSLKELLHLRGLIDNVRIEESVSDYLFKISAATREHPQLRLGVSTRGSLLFARMTRALALSQGRDFVIPEDIKQLAVPVLSHRILLNTQAQHGGLAAADVITQLMNHLRVPR